MAADINKSTFDDKTLLKLDIFRECFREWFPVFLHNPFIERIYIMDMFAGSGTDIEGNPGSPLILIDEARGQEDKYCKHAEEKRKDIRFWFNEAIPSKVAELNENVGYFMNKCAEDCSLD